MYSITLTLKHNSYDDRMCLKNKVKKSLNELLFQFSTNQCFEYGDFSVNTVVKDCTLKEVIVTSLDHPNVSHIFIRKLEDNGKEKS
jgi:hypothetical protein